MNEIIDKNKNTQTKTSSKGSSSGPRSRGGFRSSRGGRDSAPPEFEQKTINVRRVTRVVKGGRRFSFSVLLVIGNRRGRVGVGIGKATDISLAMEKAFRAARKNLIELKLTDTFSIPHETEAKFSGSRVVIRPAPGRGIVAGSAMRVILELAGVRAVSGKILSPSKNHLNNATATIKALDPFATRVK